MVDEDGADTARSLPSLDSEEDPLSRAVAAVAKLPSRTSFSSDDSSLEELDGILAKMGAPKS